MDSWSFNSMVKAFEYDESLSTADAFEKDQNGSMGWEVKPPFVYGNNNMGLFPNEKNIEDQMFVDIGFPPLMKNSSFSPAMAASHKAFSEDNDSNSKFESNSRESELFDLKLGRLTDQKEAQIFHASKIAHNLSPSEVARASKRPREGSFGSSTPFCKVQGCKKNLSNCKEYHKRHKVCEVHAKTPKVIVNGMEQRFCQQCSRFHLLPEFDDGKRSCRKRLAGHNQRRRKPQAGVFSERHGRLLPSYIISVEGNEFKRSTEAISSFSIPNNLRSLYQPNYETSDRWQMDLDHNLQSMSRVTDEQTRCPCNLERNPRFNGILGTSTSLSTGSALSLLSYQSWSSSCHSSRIQTSNSQSHPVWSPSPCEVTQDSTPLNQLDMNPIVGVEDSLVKFANEGSKYMNSEDRVFPDEGCIDLLQLSSQLDRVEHQKRKSHANGVSV